MNDREIVAAALRWQAARNRRLSIGTIKNRIDKDIKDSDFGVFSRLLTMQIDTDARLTEAKRLERATLRALAKACEKQRGRLGDVEDADLVIDAKLLPWEP